MKSRIQKWGNSLAVRIPKSFAVEAGLDVDAMVDLALVEGKLVVTPQPEPVAIERLLLVSPRRIAIVTTSVISL